MASPVSVTWWPFLSKHAALEGGAAQGVRDQQNKRLAVTQMRTGYKSNHVRQCPSQQSLYSRASCKSWFSLLDRQMHVFLMLALEVASKMKQLSSSRCKIKNAETQKDKFAFVPLAAILKHPRLAKFYMHFFCPGLGMFSGYHQSQDCQTFPPPILIHLQRNLWRSVVEGFLMMHIWCTKGTGQACWSSVLTHFLLFTFENQPLSILFLTGAVALKDMELALLLMPFSII